MNAAARKLDGALLFRGSIWQLRFNREMLVMLSLTGLILISALMIVYVKYQQRSVFSQIQHAQVIANRLQVEKGQLLLERTSIATPSRLHQVAAEQLAMQYPHHKKTLFLSE